MKKIISVLAIAGITVMASCGSAALREQEVALKAQQHTIDSMKIAMDRQHVIDSMNEVSKKQLAATAAAVPKKARKRTPARSYAYSSKDAYTGNRTQPVYTAPEAPVETQKKGWSAKAKGAVIGAGTGAVAGAVINKRNRTAGAVIGGLLGAGAGTGIGAIIDKKNGR